MTADYQSALTKIRDQEWDGRGRVKDEQPLVLLKDNFTILACLCKGKKGVV